MEYISNTNVQLSDKKVSKPIPFITCSDEDEGFQLVPEAIEYLKEIENDIAIVSIAGLYRTGKSYLLNLLLGRHESNEMFDVGGTVNAQTKGIWIWGEPLDIENKKVTVIFMDTEGLGSTKRTQTQDTRIFALALLLSSYFIYNSRGVIDTGAIEELSLVINLSKHIQLQAKDSLKVNENAGDLAEYFPAFMWVLRDFTLQLEEDGKRITPRDYLEHALKPQEGYSDSTKQNNQVRSLLASYFPKRDCTTLVRPSSDENLLKELIHHKFDTLRPEFQREVLELKSKVYRNLEPKRIMSKTLNGSMLVSLAQAYIDSFNSGSSPVISSAWDRVLKNQCEEAYEKAFSQFETTMSDAFSCITQEDAGMLNGKQLSMPMDEDCMQQHYISISNTAIQEYESIASLVEKHMLIPNRQRLNIMMLESYSRYLNMNKQVSTEYCTALFEQLYNPIPFEKEDLQTEESIDVVAQTLETYLERYHDMITKLIEDYQNQAIGPEKDIILAKFLNEKVIDACSRTGNAISNLFRSKNGILQRNINTSKQKLKGLEGKSKAIEDILMRQKESYERALQTARERLNEDRSSMVTEIQQKQSEIDRALQQMDKISTLHAESVSRIDKQIDEARQQVTAIEDQLDEERKRRENDLRGANRELLESERHFHQEEKSLVQKQQGLLSRIVDLQRQLGEIKAKNMREILTLQQDSGKRLNKLRTDHEEKIENLKIQTKSDIKALKNKHDEELAQLQDELTQKQATLSALKEKIYIKQQLYGCDGKKKKKGKKDDCIVQ